MKNYFFYLLLFLLFSNSYSQKIIAFVRETDHWGIINQNEEKVLNDQYDYLWAPILNYWEPSPGKSIICYPEEGLFRFREKDRWGFVDISGKVVIEPKYNLAYDFSEGFAIIVLSGSYGYIDKSGRLISEPKYFGAMDFSEGIGLVCHKNKWKYIDTAGKFFLIKHLRMHGLLKMVMHELDGKAIGA